MNGLYNGKTIAEIETNLNPRMIPAHRELYLNNCKEVIKNETDNMNLGYNECLRNSNFHLTNLYLTEVL